MPKELLLDLYLTQKHSVSSIARAMKCSENKINYWLAKYGIKKRTIAEAVYQFKNPSGDPFLLRKPRGLEEGILWGLGVGLYWGEGSKKGNGGLRLTNSDPRLIKKFLQFLETFCGVDRNRVRFSLQVFRDIPPEKALRYWTRELGVTRKQFYKTIVSKVRGVGTYTRKSEYGVIILYFNNIKLKRLVCQMIENIR